MQDVEKNDSFSAKHLAYINSCNLHNHFMGSKDSSTLHLKEWRHRELDNLLKFTPLGNKVLFLLIVRAAGMERAFCTGPGQLLSLWCQAGQTFPHAQQPILTRECAFQEHTAPLSLTFPPMAASPVA